MDKLRVRVYNVRFGDAILISIPDKDPASGATVTKHIVVDVGNAASFKGEGASDQVFEPVVKDILQETKPGPIDLYIMTHEHMDHVQGLLYASMKLNKRLKFRNAWFTASAAPDYYKTHRKAKEKKLALERAFDEIKGFFDAAPACFGDANARALFQTMLLNNNPQSTDDCIEYLQGLTGDPKRNTYVYRGCDLVGRHNFREAKFDLWAPEEDTSVYYKKPLPMTLAALPGQYGEGAPAAAPPIPPAGVDAGSFYTLIEMRRQGCFDNLLMIDKAENNTSVVFTLEWRNWKLLFTGDAEQASWHMMDDQRKLGPVHFLKVSHHGSANGTPPLRLLDKILPKATADGRPRYAVVSTFYDTYHGIPDRPTLKEIGTRCEVKSTVDDLGPEDFYLDYFFEG